MSRLANFIARILRKQNHDTTIGLTITDDGSENPPAQGEPTPLRSDPTTAALKVTAVPPGDAGPPGDADPNEPVATVASRGMAWDPIDDVWARVQHSTDPNLILGDKRGLHTFVLDGRIATYPDPSATYATAADAAGEPLPAMYLPQLPGALGPYDSLRVFPVSTRLDPAYVRFSSQDGFGRPVVAEITPVVQATFTNGAKTSEWENYTTLTGTVTTLAETDGLGYARTNANASSVAELRSVSSFTYRAGQSFEVLFTSVFSVPETGGQQYVGGGSNDAVAVGFDNRDFVFLIRSGGKAEQRTLTITTASSTAENVTVTLSGVGTSVAVTNAAGNTVTTAREIAAGNYSAAGPGWDAYQLGSTVIFVARLSGPRSGSYSLTATTAVGSFAQRLAGADPTDIKRQRLTEWTGDRLDGDGPTGALLDTIKGQIWKVVVSHLGFGSIDLYWQDPTTGEFVLCHRELYANVSALPNLANPTLRLWIHASGAANIWSASRSMVLACHGPVKLNGRTLAIPAATKTNVGTSFVPVLSIRVEKYDNGNTNRCPFKPLVMMFTAAATGEVIIHAYLNPTLTGSNFQSHPTDPVLAHDTAATAFSGGFLIGSFCTSRNGSGVPIDVANYGLALQPGSVVAFVAMQNTGAAATVIISINGYLDSGNGSEN